MRTVLSTNNVHKRDRVDYWREIICQSFVQLDCTQVLHKDFSGEILSHGLGQVQFSSVISQPQHVIRSKTQISRANDGTFLISLQRAGQGYVIQDGREAKLGVGDFALYDSTRPYELHFEKSFEQLVLKMPTALIHQHFSAPERVTATTIDGSQGMGRIASQFLQSVANQAENLEEPLHNSMANNLLDIVAAALNIAAPVGRHSGSSSRTVLLRRIMIFIQENLRDPELSPGIIAQAHRITPRYLSKLFEDENLTVARLIWTKRLEACRLEMKDPRHSGRTISEIAFGWGFNDMSHFSRAFRQKFGCSPRTYRSEITPLS